ICTIQMPSFLFDNMESVWGCRDPRCCPAGRTRAEEAAFDPWDRSVDHEFRSFATFSGAEFGAFAGAVDAADAEDGQCDFGALADDFAFVSPGLHDFKAAGGQGVSCLSRFSPGHDFNWSTDPCSSRGADSHLRCC